MELPMDKVVQDESPEAHCSQLKFLKLKETPREQNGTTHNLEALYLMERYHEEEIVAWASKYPSIHPETMNFRLEVLKQIFAFANELKERVCRGLDTKQLKRSTIHSSISIMDRWLRRIKVNNLRKWQGILLYHHYRPQRVAATLLWLSVKIEESMSFSLFTPLLRPNGNWHVSPNLEMEMLVAIDAKVYAPIPTDFAHFFLNRLGHELTRISEDTQLVAYLLDLATFLPKYPNLKPSTVAAAAVKLCRHVALIGLENSQKQSPLAHPWPQAAVQITGAHSNTLKPIMMEINKLLCNPQNPHTKTLSLLHKGGWADMEWHLANQEANANTGPNLVGRWTKHRTHSPQQWSNTAPAERPAPKPTSMRAW